METSFIFFKGVQSRRPEPKPQPPRPAPPAPPYPDEVDGFFCDLFERAGLKSGDYRGSALQRRIPACLRFLRVPDLEAARLKLAARPDLVAETLDVVLLGVTGFFRDQAVFDQLQKAVIPGLRQLGRPIRVWSAACSEGRELYSIAILLHEGGLTEMELLGTDCRQAAIRAAREGRFSGQALEQLPPEWRKHFTALGDSVHISAQIKRQVRWKQADLITSIERGPWDLILWRNMAIYLNAHVSDKVWNGLVPELAPSGYLVSGTADHAPRHTVLQKIGRGIYQKQELP